jgi:hypothetical protein
MQASRMILVAFGNCMNYGDSEEIEEFVNAGGTGARMDYYITIDASDQMEAFVMGAEAEEVARKLGLHAYYGESDGNGVWVFTARSEGHVVAILQKAAAKMCEALAETSEELETEEREATEETS